MQYVGVLVVFICFSCSSGQHDEEFCRYSILEDSSARLSPEQVWHLFQSNRFSAQRSSSLNPGFTNSVYWLVAEKKSNSIDNLKLEIGTPHINNIEFYEVLNNNPIRKISTGDHYSFDERPEPALNYLFPLDPTVNSFLIRVDKKGEALQLTFRTRTEDYFHTHTIESSLIAGILTGLIVLMCIFGFFLFLITTEKVYLFYMLYVLTIWLYVLTNLGYGFQYFWPENPWFAERSRPVFTLLSLAFSLHFLEYYTGKALNRWLQKTLRVLGYCAYGLLILLFTISNIKASSSVGYYFQIALPVMAFVYLFSLFVSITQKIVNKNRMALFYLISFMPILAFTGLQLFYYSGGLDISGSFFQNYGQPTGIVFQAVILTFGLVYRFNSYRLEKERLLVETNKQEVKYARAILTTQENERKQLADQLHDFAGSLLSSAKLNLSSVREKNFITHEDARLKLRHAEDAITDISEMLRNLSHALSPVMLDKIGLRQSVEKIVNIFNSAGRFKVELEMIGFEINQPELHEKFSVLYGILYELMNNIAKHAKASHALIQLIEHEESLVMIVEDDGIGFEVGAFSSKDTHGMTAIQSKIHYLGGTIAFDKAVPNGLIVAIEIPKENDDKNYSSG